MLDFIDTQAIYFIETNEGKIAKRIDSEMIEPMHNVGYPIIKMFLKTNEMERLEPNQDIPEGFITKSEYGMCVILRKENEDA